VKAEVETVEIIQRILKLCAFYNNGNANKLFVPRSLDLLILASKGAFELGEENTNPDLRILIRILRLLSRI